MNQDDVDRYARDDEWRDTLIEAVEEAAREEREAVIRFFNAVADKAVNCNLDYAYHMAEAAEMIERGAIANDVA